MGSRDLYVKDSPLDSKPAYAGIGSRQTPPDICLFMTDIARFLEHKGYVLRSGGASGADCAFESGVTDPANKEIFLPWRGFNMHPSKLCGVTSEALEMAAKFHPAWDECSTGARELHGRNCYQVMGRDLASPSKFVVCWTKGGKLVGGTSQAMRIARAMNIPIINLGYPKNLDFVGECIRTDQVFVA